MGRYLASARFLSPSGLKNLPKVFFCISLLAASLGSCSAPKIGPTLESPRERAFSNLFADAQDDGTISLSLVPAMGDALTPGGSISLALRNHGDLPVVFETGFNIEGFVFLTGEGVWKAIPNSLDYPSGRWLLGARNSGISDLTVIDYGLSDRAEVSSDTLRVVVIGSLLLDDDILGEKVMAHLDVPVSGE